MELNEVLHLSDLQALDCLNLKKNPIQVIPHQNYSMILIVITDPTRLQASHHEPFIITLEVRWSVAHSGGKGNYVIHTLYHSLLYYI